MTVWSRDQWCLNDSHVTWSMLSKWQIGHVTIVVWMTSMSFSLHWSRDLSVIKAKLTWPICHLVLIGHVTNLWLIGFLIVHVTNLFLGNIDHVTNLFFRQHWSRDQIFIQAILVTWSVCHLGSISHVIYLHLGKTFIYAFSLYWPVCL